MNDILRIREMLLEDIPKVAEMEQEIFPTPWSETGMRDLLIKNPICKGIIAETENKIAGYGFFWVVADELHIANIAVQKGYRRRQFGEKLLLKMIEYGRRNGAEYAILEVRESNIPAIMMYRKYGFQVTDIRKNYYSDNQENAFIMTADIKR